MSLLLINRLTFPDDQQDDPIEVQDSSDSPDGNDGLPGLGNDSSFEINASNDPFLFDDDNAETITISDSDGNLSPVNLPLYQNQEEDPEVAAMMFNWFNVDV